MKVQLSIEQVALSVFFFFLFFFHVIACHMLCVVKYSKIRAFDLGTCFICFKVKLWLWTPKCANRFLQGASHMMDVASFYIFRSFTWSIGHIVGVSVLQNCSYGTFGFKVHYIIIFFFELLGAIIFSHLYWGPFYNGIVVNMICK